MLFLYYYSVLYKPLRMSWRTLPGLSLNGSSENDHQESGLLTFWSCFENIYILTAATIPLVMQLCMNFKHYCCFNLFHNLWCWIFNNMYIIWGPKGVWRKHMPVSYTHLDVYKRQSLYWSAQCVQVHFF